MKRPNRSDSKYWASPSKFKPVFFGDDIDKYINYLEEKVTRGKMALLVEKGLLEYYKSKLNEIN